MSREILDTALSVARSPSSRGVTESADLLQERLKVYFGMVTAVCGGLYLGGFLLIGIFRPAGLGIWDSHAHPVKIVNLGLIVLMFALWQLLRRKRLTMPVLRALDVAAPLAVVWAAGLALALLPAPPATLGVLMIALLLLTLRAALVPSPPRRTAAIALVAGLAVLQTVFRAAIDDGFLPGFLTPALLTTVAGVWCVAIGVTTTITSRVIYGLEREVQDARRLGQYTLVEKLGEGGMGAVYLARHAMLRRPTAVKLLLPDRAGSANLARFEREVQLTSMLTHPNTISIYDYGRTTDGVFYYAMEYVDGISLEQLVRAHGPLPIARVIHVLRQIASALADAHRVGLIHRDVKPANVLLCERGGMLDSVKVVDFGLVKQLAAPDDATVTQANTITGTPAYLAPEMIASPMNVDARADHYGLGGVGYFMLTGAPVFDGGSVVEVCGHHLHSIPAPPSERRGQPVPERLERFILACLAKQPDDRPSDMEAELVRLAAEHPWGNADASEWWDDWRRSRQTAPPAAAE